MTTKSLCFHCAALVAPEDEAAHCASHDGKRLASAWDEWITSEEGVQCVDAFTLGVTGNKDTYLRNRLWRAFMAGAAVRDVAKQV